MSEVRIEVTYDIAIDIKRLEEYISANFSDEEIRVIDRESEEVIYEKDTTQN